VNRIAATSSSVIAADRFGFAQRSDDLEDDSNYVCPNVKPNNRPNAIASPNAIPDADLRPDLTPSIALAPVVAVSPISAVREQHDNITISNG
jgi:hypothetical protein